MLNTIGKAWKKVRRDLDRGRTVTEIASKSARYAVELASAKVYLASIDELGVKNLYTHLPNNLQIQ